jgi:hypothetical protein
MKENYLSTEYNGINKRLIGFIILKLNLTGIIRT